MEEYELHDAHRPVLSPGSYTVSVSWQVIIDLHKEDGAVEATSFEVVAERLALEPSDVKSLYPPEGSRGPYDNSLPHIALSCDTLPWQRAAKNGSDAPPWLALLLLHQEEAASCPLRTITVSEYRQAASLTPGTAQDAAEAVQVIDCPAELLRSALPTTRELPLLCHVRTTKTAGQVTEATAMVVSKRLPKHGNNVAHLVAVNDRYPDIETRYLGTAPATPPLCALISLKSWTFVCEPEAADRPESLDKLFANVNAGWLRLPGGPPEAAGDYRGLGFVPLQHRFRTGESAATWYAGPLIPELERSFDPSLVKLPARSADELLWYDTDLGMLNATYAAAWELGRLLVLQNRRVFSLLQDWRRQHIHCAHAAAAAAPGSDCCHVPQIQCACSEAPETPPLELTNWVDGLRQLQGVPYRYLIADERLLPQESVRFFAVDAWYIDALLNGGLSTVRTPTFCPDHCRAGELTLVNHDAPGPVTGFLFRSAAVAGWPGLEVTALPPVGQTPLKIYRTAQLSPSILLYMFRGIAKTVTIAQKAGTAHLSVPAQLGRTVDLSQYKSSSELASKLLNRDRDGAVQRPQRLELSIYS